SDSIREENQTPESVDRLPRSPDFVLSEPGSGFTPRFGSSDSPEAMRFKTGLRDIYTLIGGSARVAEVAPRNRIEIAALADETINAITLNLTIPRRTFQTIMTPDRLKAVLTEEFKEAMASPEIDQPMYEPLKEISSELFLPNINLIEQNSVTLLET